MVYMTTIALTSADPRNPRRYQQVMESLGAEIRLLTPSDDGSLEALPETLMEGLALSLGLAACYFEDHYTRDPLILFRIFHYPSLGNLTSRSPASEPVWSVGEHTDYGILTILLQDNTGGLQVKSRSRWIEAPPLPGSLVCNIGDMLDRMTGGLYRSTPHRVLNETAGGRLSFPFFFDPNFDAEVQLINAEALVADDKRERWDGSSVHELSGTYGEYLMKKVSKVFPELSRRQL